MTSTSALGGLLRRPEAGAFFGLLAVLIFFAFFGGLTFLKPAGMASWLNVAANLGVIAIPVGLLMIAGELGIAVGAMVPFGAMTVALISGHYGLPIWLGIAVALAIARAVHFGARVLILDEPTAALGVKQATHVLRIVNEAKRRGLAVIFITHQVMHAMAVGDHFAVLIRGAVAADFRKGERSREEITDLMAGGETMAGLEAQIETYMASHDGHPPQPAHS